jgi:catechol 2,3-dioxygenase-like lactoylglutathione lyase family enzyme
MELRFDCVFYYVRDLDAAVRFYSDTLGLALVSQDAVARFDVDGVLLELVPALDDSRMAGGGNARLCLRVDDIEYVSARLRERGVAIGVAHREENGRFASFRDPDGNELALWEYAS